MLLKIEGFRVSLASSLAEAVARAGEHPDIDVLISDYHLGNGETGTEVIASVRGILGPRLGAVLVTGDTSSAIKELRHDERVRTTSKPIRAEELLALTRALLSS
jgi:CheY-like chemotaxis protein